MPNDKFGIKMIYPSISGTDIPKAWFIYDGFSSDKRVRLDERVSGNNNDGYKLSSNEKVRLTVCADTQDVDIGCSADFTKATLRGYVYKSNDWMAKANSGVEMTAYFKMSSIDQSDSTVKGNPIIMKGPTGEHHSNTDCCSGASHMIHIGGLGEDWENDLAMRYSKEMWHVSYHTRSDYKAINGETQSFLDMGWVGFKYIIYKKTVNNVKSVVVETWINNNADKQSWKKALVTTDTGGWGDDGDECNGRKDDRLAFGNARMMLRWDHRDGSDLRFKNVSIRPINPYAEFDEDPTLPDTNVPTVTTFRSTLKLLRNINSDTGQGCGVPGNQIFFEINATTNLIERFLSNHTDHDYRTIVAQEANPAGGSSMVGDKPLEARFEIRKVGTPAGTCRAKIWDSTGVEKYASTNTITCTSLPATFDGILETFDMSTNTYQIQSGDRIGIQYTASTDPDNCISVRARDPGDGSTGTYYAYYNSNTNTWGKITSRDLVCQLWS